MNRLGFARVGDRNVDRAAAEIFDIGARRVEVRVRRDDLTRNADAGEKYALRSPPLVRGDHVAETEELFDARLEPEPRARARVRLVAAHDSRPLFRGHRPGSRIGEEVDEDILGANLEHVPTRLGENLASFLAGRHADRLDALDAERLDDRSHEFNCPRRAARSPPDAGMQGRRRAWRLP